MFGEDWVEHVSAATNAYTNAYTRNQQNIQQTRFAEFPERAMEMSSDYYTGDNPGFIFCAQTSQVVREMIGRKVVFVQLSYHYMQRVQYIKMEVNCVLRLCLLCREVVSEFSWLPPLQLQNQGSPLGATQNGQTNE